MRPCPARRPGWPRGWSCSASTRTPATASRRRWSGGPTARSSRCLRCCTRWPAGSTAPATRMRSRRWSAPTSAGHWTPSRSAISLPRSCFPLASSLRRASRAPCRRLTRCSRCRARGTLLPERGANAAGTLLRPLFRWPVVVAVVVSVAAVDCWLFAVHGLGAGVQQVLRDPVDLLVVLGLSLVSAAFHECGHAAGCRYGGARPGVIGVGIYLVWPAFFTNVTDSYRRQPRRAAADRPRRPVLQPGLHAGPGRHLRGHLGRDPAPGHRASRTWRCWSS